MNRNLPGTVALICLFGGAANAAPFANSLWIGNDNSQSLPVLNTDLSGNILQQIAAPVPTSGIAIDIQNNLIYLGGNFGSAAITPRNLTTLVPGNSFTPAVNFQEDMTFDGTYIWRISSQLVLEKIVPGSNSILSSFSLSGNI